MDKIYKFLIFILKYLYFKKAKGSHFDWHYQNRNHTY